MSARNCKLLEFCFLHIALWGLQHDICFRIGSKTGYRVTLEGKSGEPQVSSTLVFTVNVWRIALFRAIIVTSLIDFLHVINEFVKSLNRKSDSPSCSCDKENSSATCP